MSLLGPDRKHLKQLLKKHYPERYCELYGLDPDIVPRLPKKRLLKEVEKLGIKGFKAMNRMQLAQCLADRKLRS